MSPDTSCLHPIRALVIGAGAATVLLHLPVLADLRKRGGLVLAVVCDIERDRAATARRDFGFAEDCGDAAAALARHDIDAVYVFGSAQLHYEYGLAALRSGKHLFVEKPIAPSYTEACHMAEAAAALRLVAVGGHNRRFYAAFTEVRARAGKGGWRFAEAVFHKPENGKPPPFGARTWLGANGIHGLDALLFMMNGLPEQMTSQAGDALAGEPSAFSALMRWRSGAQGIFLCNNNAGARREEYAFHGFDETYRVTESELSFEKGGAGKRAGLPPAGNGFAAEHESFLRAIRHGVEPPHAITAIAPSLFLAELIEEGFSGRVQLPQSMPARLPPPRRYAKSILITQAPGLLPAIARHLPEYRLVPLRDVAVSTDERADVVAAILGRGSPALAPEVLDKLPQLTVVGVAGLSLKAYTPEALLQRGITLVNASAAYAESVAEFALGLAILARRRAFVSHCVMREGGWGTALRTRGLRGVVKRTASSLRPAIRAARLEPSMARIWRAARPWVEAPADRAGRERELQGAAVGLIGWGAIAKAFAERLVRARARPLVYSEHASDADIMRAGATRASLSEVLAADIVSLHRGLTKQTRHFMGAAELDKLRPGATLINVARGALIEPAALLARLRQGDIFACLDTFEEEPPAASHPLRRLPNVFLTSHIAGGSPDMHAAAADEVVQKVALHLGGDEIESVSAQQLSTMT